MRLYRNNKTGDHYWLIGSATNCTNQEDGQKMVMYYDPRKPDQMLVREVSEFREKFTAVTSPVEVRAFVVRKNGRYMHYHTSRLAGSHEPEWVERLSDATVFYSIPQSGALAKEMVGAEQVHVMVLRGIMEVE